MRRFVGVGLVFFTAIAIVAVFVMSILSPHIVRLALDGFPKPTGPAPSHYATLNGVTKPVAMSPLPESVGSMDKTGRELFTQTGGRALLIHHEGTFAFEHYGESVSAKTKLNSYSIVKSLIGALILKALAEDRIASLQDPIGLYLPKMGDRQFRAIPIHSFLTMSTGIEFEATKTKPSGRQHLKDVEKLRLNPFEPMARLHMLGLKSVNEHLRVNPNTYGNFSYQNINTSVLGALLTEIYQQPLQDLVDQKIWRPAGAGIADWRRPNQKLPVTAYCCLFATARDWLRIGVFLLNNGTPSEPFLPDTLWRTYLGFDLRYNDIRNGKYGFQMRHDVLDRPGESLQGPFAFMFGNGGQVIYLMPQEQLVVIRFGREIQLLHSTLYSAWRTISPTQVTPLQ